MGRVRGLVDYNLQDFWLFSQINGLILKVHFFFSNLYLELGLPNQASLISNDWSLYPKLFLLKLTFRIGFFFPSPKVSIVNCSLWGWTPAKRMGVHGAYHSATTQLAISRIGIAQWRVFQIKWLRFSPKIKRGRLMHWRNRAPYKRKHNFTRRNREKKKKKWAPRSETEGRLGLSSFRLQKTHPVTWGSPSSYSKRAQLSSLCRYFPKSSGNSSLSPTPLLLITGNNSPESFFFFWQLFVVLRKISHTPKNISVVVHGGVVLGVLRVDFQGVEEDRKENG